MTLTPVSSSNIAAVGYDKESQTLGIEFRSGGTYEYFDVPESVYESFIQSASLGKFFQTELRGRYRYVRR